MAAAISILWLLSLIAVANGYRVLELSDRFLDVRKDGMWLVKFYAPWCGHCKKLEPIWNQVAQSLHNTLVRVGRVDCTRYTAVATEFKVKGFPTILFIGGDTVHTYSGDRIREDIVDFALRLSGPPVRFLEKFEEFLYAKQKHPVFFLYIGEEDDSESWSIFQNVSEKFQVANYFYRTLPSTVQQEFQYDQWPQIAVVKDETHFLYETSEDTLINETLPDWVLKERFVLFPKITNGNFHQLLMTGKYVVMAVLNENKIGQVSPQMEEFRTMVHSVVTTYKDRFTDSFQFGWLAQPEIANSIAMETLPIPSLIVLNSETYHHFIPQDDPTKLTVDAVANFLELVSKRAAPAYGGDTILVRLRRAFYEGRTSLYEMWRGNPVLTAVLFGLPLGFLSLICYSICCSDIMEASEEEELLERERRHAKKE